MEVERTCSKQLCHDVQGISHAKAVFPAPPAARSERPSQGKTLSQHPNRSPCRTQTPGPQAPPTRPHPMHLCRSTLSCCCCSAAPTAPLKLTMLHPSRPPCNNSVTLMLIHLSTTCHVPNNVPGNITFPPAALLTCQAMQFNPVQCYTQDG